MPFPSVRTMPSCWPLLLILLGLPHRASGGGGRPIHRLQCSTSVVGKSWGHQKHPQGRSGSSSLLQLPSLESSKSQRKTSIPTRAVDDGRVASSVPSATVSSVPAQTAIVGAGPTGLATALMLLRRGWENITIYDRLASDDLKEEQSDFRSKRSYNIGLNGRGQVALEKLGAMERIKRYSIEVRGRKEWGPKGTEVEEREFTDRRYFTRVLLRNTLVQCLREEVVAQAEERGAGVNFVSGVECVDAEWDHDDSNRVTLSFEGRGGDATSPSFKGTFDFVVGVDGSASSIRNAMIRTQQMGFNQQPRDALCYTNFEPSNTRVYRTLLLDLPEGWRYDVNYAARGDRDREILFDALPLDDKTLLGAVLSRPGNPKMQNLTRESARGLIHELFPQFGGMVSDESLDEFASKSDSRLPEFSFCDGSLHRLNSTVLLGDAIHTVKPYFGLGVNSAFEDVITLRDAMDRSRSGNQDDDDFENALREFSGMRGPNARALVELSRSFDKDTRNPVNLASFLVPLLLDSTFHRLLPGIFERTALGLLQDERYSFQEVVQRKYRDRVLQMASIISIFLIMGELYTALSRGI